MMNADKAVTAGETAILQDERNDSSSRVSNASTAKRLVTRLGCNQLFACF